MSEQGPVPEDFQPEEVQKPELSRREELWMSIDRKVQIGLKIYDIAEQTNPNEPLEVTKEKLQGPYQDVANQYPRAVEALEQKDRLATELKNIGDENLDHEQSLYSEIRKLDNPDVHFLESIRNGVSWLNDKRRQVYRSSQVYSQRGKDGLTFLPAELRNFQGEVEFKAFSIDFFLPEKEFGRFYNRIYNKKGAPPASGLHMLGTPYNFILGSSSDHRAQQTYLHEELHNVTWGFLPQQSFSQKALREIGKRVDKLIKFTDWGLESFAQEHTVPILQRHIKGFVDSIQGEFLAQIPKELFQIEESIGEREMLETILKRGAGKDYVLPTLPNTSWYIGQLAKQLREKAEKVPNPSVKKTLKMAADSAWEEYFRTEGAMIDAFKVAKASGKEKELVILSMLFPPSRYHHINEYFMYKMGDDEYYEALEAGKG